MEDVELDPVIHAQARLRIMATLDMTGGNLSTHLRKLEEANYLLLTKTHEGRKPATYLELTLTGRRAFEQYTATLTTLLNP